MATIELPQMGPHLLVTNAGVDGVNGRYLPQPGKDSCGAPMYRRVGSNIALLRWEDGNWYLADCGEEFTPAGEDHLDYYSIPGNSPVPPVGKSGWVVEEDGKGPLPEVHSMSGESETKGFSAGLMGNAKSFFNKSDFEKARVFCVSALAGFETFDGFLTLARIERGRGDEEMAYEALATLGDANWIKLGAPDNHYTKEQRMSASQFLEELKPVKGSEDIPYLCECLKDYRIHRFVDYIVKAGRVLLHLLDPVEAGEDWSDEAADLESVELALKYSERQMLFKKGGGLEVAHGLRQLYRHVEWLTFDLRDTALTRTKIFSMADRFRFFGESGSKVDKKGMDLTFKSFWNTDVDNKNSPYQSSAMLKDSDPNKEKKCPVIKNINEGDAKQEEADQEKWRERLWASNGLPMGSISIDKLHEHNSNNPELKLISIHGVVFDVTDNLDKYAPDGEYFFFGGRDITYPLATSALNGDYADKFFKMTPIMRKKVYGWMEYFEKKYKVVAKLDTYEKEADFEEAPPEDEQPDMECSIM